jgi:hypothetical protein
VLPHPTGLSAAVGVLLLASAPASAHELIVQYQVLVGHQIRVESFYELGDPPRKGKVSVFRADDSLLHEGDLDDKGFHVFSYDKVEELRIEVRDKTLHKGVVKVSAVELEGARRRQLLGMAACLPAPPANWAGAVLFGHPPEAPPPLSTVEQMGPMIVPEEPTRSRGERHGSSTLADVLAGAALLLSMGAFYLGVRNARTLREMKNALEKR